MFKKTILLTLLLSSCAHSRPLEVLHWWTAPGETQALKTLQSSLAEHGVQWKNFSIKGEGGNSAMRVLQMRALAGTPPDVAQIKGPDISTWATVGMIKSMDEVVNTKQWSHFLPEVVQQTIHYKGKFMAVPINIHRVNWLWLNKKIFTQLHLSPPQTWDDFFKSADKIKAAGYIALAHGGTVWQDVLLFESMALSMLGPEKYKQAFIEHDKNVLISSEMIQLFKQYKRLHQYTDAGLMAKDWFEATQLLIDDKAAMQFMGDWAKGMFYVAGKKPMQDYLCVDVPESKGYYSYNIDSFVFFNKHSEDKELNDQKIFVNTILSKKFQKEFSRNKGSIPVRTDMDMSTYDVCAQKSYQDFKQDALVPSFTQNIATTSSVQNVVARIISDYFNDPKSTAIQAVQHLYIALKTTN
ncbi:sugar ABC transporter extracellular solute-binding family 1 protein [Psychromonas sp. CNPT3]|uniref:ABC transporter substrate-binding protein n=1 Tax=Psychromonas sp. CNPT3 TaxID=314282 RepID=UPI00006E5372|nr:ABC transporter substrate-binding protein [Psychromonas sp. CNPT3]AGH81583.1 sugar ABC transporter extracellular solute-binding family 1 protein [Psychromonas sp. CNPT3]